MFPKSHTSIASLASLYKGFDSTAERWTETYIVALEPTDAGHIAGGQTTPFNILGRLRFLIVREVCQHNSDLHLCLKV